MSPFSSNVAERIALLRHNLKMSSSNIAGELGITQEEWELYEQGEIPSVELLQQLAILYDVSLHWLLTGQDEMFVHDHHQRLLALTTENRRLQEENGKLKRFMSGNVLLEHEDRILALEQEIGELKRRKTSK